MDKTLSGTTGGEQPKKPQGSLPVPKSKRGLKGFFNDVNREMKKVSWPSRAETNRLTGVVLAVCGLVVLSLSVMSYVFDIVVTLITKGTV